MTTILIVIGAIALFLLFAFCLIFFLWWVFEFIGLIQPVDDDVMTAEYYNKFEDKYKDIDDEHLC